jgi:hypothetical protein
MNNEYNSLEENLYEKDLNEHEKLKILERQKELLLQFLIDSNKSLFKSLKVKNDRIKAPENVICFFDVY